MILTFRTDSPTHRDYTISFEFDGEWWVADVMNLSGCHTQGKTFNEARHRIWDAIVMFEAT